MDVAVFPIPFAVAHKSLAISNMLRKKEYKGRICIRIFVVTKNQSNGQTHREEAGEPLNYNGKDH